MSKSAARKAAQRVVKMTKCEICGATTKLNRHHVNYEKYIDVIVLCSKCHAQLHEHSISGRRKMARRVVCGKYFYPTHSKKGQLLCGEDCRSFYLKICAMKRWHGGKWNLIFQELQRRQKTEWTDLDVSETR